MKKLSDCVVLIVDDTEDNLDILVETLGNDYEVSVAMDGENALESIKMEVPDIILLDIMMPGMDGYEVCRRIKADKNMEDTPIIFLTAITDVDSKTKGFELGAVDYITKPFEIMEVQARVRTHLSLKLAKHQLSDKNQILNEKTIELKSAVSELEAFSYTISHDLKSPLRAIEACVRMIIEDEGKMLDRNTYETINNIKSMCDSMIYMIEKLLEYSKMTHLNICREPLDISEIFNSVFKWCKSIYPERCIKFEFETGVPVVLADKVLMNQVIYNIISNAVKFTKNRKKALIVVGCKRGADEYIFYVRDNGVGIDMEFAGKLFGIFQKLHSPDEFEGNGIGLAIVKKIIEKHGGKVWIESEVEEGTTIYFALPADIH